MLLTNQGTTELTTIKPKDLMSIPKIKTATIYGPTDQIFQDVFYTYEVRPDRSRWFDDETPMHEVERVSLKMPLLINPSDLKTDLEVAIAEDLGIEPECVRIQCTIELCHQIVEDEKLNTETLFV